MVKLYLNFDFLRQMTSFNFDSMSVFGGFRNLKVGVGFKSNTDLEMFQKLGNQSRNEVGA